MASAPEMDLLGAAVEKLVLSKEESARRASGKHTATTSSTGRELPPTTDTTPDGQTGSKPRRNGTRLTRRRERNLLLNNTTADTTTTHNTPHLRPKATQLHTAGMATRASHSIDDSTGPKTRSQTRAQTSSLNAPTPALKPVATEGQVQYSQANFGRVSQSGSSAAPPSGPSGALKANTITRPVAQLQGMASSQHNVPPNTGFIAPPPKGPSSEAKVYSISRPVPHSAYIGATCISPSVLQISRPLLVILDLNGTLLYRRNKGSNFLPRPHLDAFLEYLFSNHVVMVWSSARPHNVINMCKQFFSPEQYNQVAAIWTRDNLHLTPEAYKSNTQVYKQLSWVWSDPRIQATNPVPNNYWDQSNTVLLDDSVEKSASEPFNLIRIDEFEGRADQKEEDVLPQVALYLNTLRSQRDASAYIRSHPFEVDPSMPRAAVEAFAVARHAAQVQSQFPER